MRDIYLNELEHYPGEQRFLDAITKIDNGTWRNPYRNQFNGKSLAWKLPFFVWLINTGIGNIIPTPYRIPLLSDLTPVVVFMQYMNGENRWEIMTQTSAYDRNRMGRRVMEAMGVESIEEGRQKMEETQKELDQLNQNIQIYQKGAEERQEQLERQWEQYNQTMKEIKPLLRQQN